MNAAHFHNFIVLEVVSLALISSLSNHVSDCFQLPLMNAWPENNSILVLDNCMIVAKVMVKWVDCAKQSRGNVSGFTDPGHTQDSGCKDKVQTAVHTNHIIQIEYKEYTYQAIATLAQRQSMTAVKNKVMQSKE